MFAKLRMLGVAAVATVLMAAPAQAATVIDFNGGLAGEGGSISWDGTNLIGSNIPIGAAYITGAPVNNGVFLVTGTTSAQGGSNFGSLNFNTNPNNNFMNISGCIAALGIGTSGDGCQPTTLLSGTFTSFTGNHNGLTDAVGQDAKNRQLMTALGLPTNLPWEFFGFAVATNGTLTPNGPAGTVISTDIRNTAVPEPATMMLLGTGLLAAFRARRRQA